MPTPSPPGGPLTVWLPECPAFFGVNYLANPRCPDFLFQIFSGPLTFQRL